jgi:hypothetical protein
MRIDHITVDAALPVLGPNGMEINQYVSGGIADEHSSIFKPGTLGPNQPGYMFFVATPLPNQEHGTLVLSSTRTKAPARTDSWVLDYARQYGNYGGTKGPVFSPAMAHIQCPQPDAKGQQDPTFDLNYAGVATVFLDPTNPTNEGGGNLLMVYEGTNKCIGMPSGPASKAFYSTIGIATSNDNGITWPTYLANFTPLPLLNQSVGPRKPLGAWGNEVCQGNVCTDIILMQPPKQYGRYAVSGPATTVIDAMGIYPIGSNSFTNAGDSEPAAFVDDVQAVQSTPPYVYAVHTYNPGPSLFTKDSPLYPQFPNVQSDLSISRAQLNGGRERLQFYHWYVPNGASQGGFTEAGLGSDTSDIGGHESPIFSTLNNTPGITGLNAYKQCLTPRQNRSAASVSYSEETHEYVLLYICASPSNPFTETQYPPPPAPQGTTTIGATWFYSTLDAEQYDLSRQDQWSTPQQVLQSSTTSPAPGFWSPFQSSGSCAADFDGWYPSMMSADAKQGHLNTTGWVFSMNGCLDGGANGQRRYLSRAFAMSLKAQSSCTNPIECCIQAGGTWSNGHCQ